MKKTIAWILAGAMTAGLVGGVGAQDTWPTRLVRVVIPFPPGSSGDVTGRVVVAQLAQQLGQPFVVENRPGANGTIGQAVVAKADPDGHTILIASSSWTVVPSTMTSLPFDPIKDLAGITVLAQIPNVLVVRPSAKIASVSELVATAKARPGKLNYATVGTGTAMHLNAARFQISAGIDVVQVPYKGSSEAVTDLLGGQVDFCFCPAPNVLPFIKEGRLVPLAVGSSRRSSALPDLPTTEEAGFPNSAYNFWIGLAAPAKTPPAIVRRLHAETVRALNQPEIKARWEALGQEMQISTPEQFGVRLQEEMASNAALVKAANIKAN
jgi:tripartite-type tricarboxylate transporter receptor subunit TctC